MRDLTDQFDGINPNFRFTTPFENTQIDFEIFYLPKGAIDGRWVINELRYTYIFNNQPKTFIINGVALKCGGWPLLYEYNLPFAIFISLNDDNLSGDPRLITSFVDGFNSFFLLERQDMVVLRGGDVP